MEEWKKMVIKSNSVDVVIQVNKEGVCLRNGKLNTLIDGQGYPIIHYCKGEKVNYYHVHRIMAHLFLGYPLDDKTKVIDHIDENKANNKLSNLQIITNSQNVSKHWKSFNRRNWTKLDLFKCLLKMVKADKNGTPLWAAAREIASDFEDISADLIHSHYYQWRSGAIKCGVYYDQYVDYV